MKVDLPLLCGLALCALHASGSPPAANKSKFPSTLSDAFEGTWTGDLKKLGFERDSGAVVMSFANFPTPTGVDIAKGKIVMRNGQFSGQDDYTLGCLGKYYPQEGKLQMISSSSVVTVKQPTKVRRLLSTSQVDLNDVFDGSSEWKSSDSTTFQQIADSSTTPTVTKVDFETLLLLMKAQGSNPEAKAEDCDFIHEYQFSSRNDDDDGTPEFSIRGTIHSPNCNLTATVEAASTNPQIIVHKVGRYVGGVITLAIAQIVLLVRQLSRSASQSQGMKISVVSLCLQTVVDAYLCLFHSTLAMMNEPLFSIFATAAFLEFVVFALFELRFLLMLWKARHPEFFSNGIDRLRRELFGLYFKFYCLLLIGLVVGYVFQNYARVLIGLLFCFWIPQIIFNVMKNSSPLTDEFTIGSSFIRLYVPLYIYGCPENIVANKPDFLFCVVLSAIVAAQLLVLNLQKKRGPRFFVPRRFLPTQFNYHTTRLREVVVSTSAGEDDLELASLMRNHNSRRSEGPGDDTKEPEDSDDEKDCCPICCCELEEDGDPLMIMTTPCKHLFHTECLTRWMEQKMECPTCRHGPLPPYVPD